MRIVNQYTLCTLVIVWSIVLLLLVRHVLYSVHKENEEWFTRDLTGRIDNLDARNLRQLDQLHGEMRKIESALEDIQRAVGGDSGPPKHERISRSSDQPREFGEEPLPVLLIACNRPSYTAQSIDSLLKYQPSPTLFPIIVSQDCGHQPTADVIKQYGDKVVHIKQPDLSTIPVPPELKSLKSSASLQGYMKISRHYKWALTQVFDDMNYSHVIIVEDDLEVAADFFSYFASLRLLLDSDPSIWCVSAWNDNGKQGFIDSNQNARLYRTDFFPGLGWMLRKELWEELKPKWPAGYWDDWMREPVQRKDRACIRPEISRTKTYGAKGVSAGQYFNSHLKYIVLNNSPVDFSKVNLTKLTKVVYDQEFVSRVLALPTAEGLPSDGPSEVQVHYSDSNDFVQIAKKFQIMSDIRGGVPRTAYRGIVSFMYRGRRVHLTPAHWSGYHTRS